MWANILLICQIGQNILELYCVKNTDWNWSHEHENEWQDLNKLLTHKPVLAYYDVTLKI